MGRALLCVLLALPVAAADYTTGGLLESDLRLSLPGKDAPPGAEDVRIIRLDNTARLKLRADDGDVSGNLDIALIYRGFPQGGLTLDGVHDRRSIDPYEIESDALFVTFSDLVVDGMELRVGRQIVQWGAADRFNPTSVLNPLDLEDPIEFGARVPNEMFVLSYTAPWSVDGENMTIFDELTFTLAFVPFHRPGQIPTSADLVFTDPDLFAQFAKSPLLSSFVDLQGVLVEKGGEFAFTNEIESPGRTFDESQYAGRVAFTAVGVDFSGTYYKGFSDSLQASFVDANLSQISVDLGGADPICGPTVTQGCGDLITGILDAADDPLAAFPELVSLMDLAIAIDGAVPTHVVLSYPEVQVIGFDATTSLDFIDGVGAWVEGAITVHDAQVLTLKAGDSLIEETVIEEGNFLKIAAGLDYTIFSWWYVNAQYLHGFVDEFGADNLNDYVVAGNDFKMFTDQLTLRLFGIYQLQDSSYIAYPALMARFWQGGEIILGALHLGGPKDTKFGSPATGQSRVFLKTRYSF